jgi:hydrogenase-4 component F
LQAHAADLNPVWLKAAFVLFVVGYGTKMGLAPMHNWLPDAHSEAPSVVSALLSGALLNCAFLAVLRFHGILSAAGLGDFSGQILVLFGFISMATAAIFLIRQTDAKRMLAYSSIEHMGILALGAGIGGAAASGALLHAVNHSLTKAMLFLTAGNLMHFYQTKDILKIRGVLKLAPVTGMLWIAGFLAIAGFPPFGLFLSEFIILKEALESGRWLVASGYLLTLGVIFVALTRIVLAMSFGAHPDPDHSRTDGLSIREKAWSVLPGIALAAAVLVLGLYVPPQFWQCIKNAALATGVH